jgi:hypothetical protein
MIDVVLFGPPLSGKTTVLMEFARKHGAPLISRRPSEHVTAPIHLIVDTPDARLITIPGAVWDESDWDPLLRDADSIVAFFDLQRAREAEVNAARERIDGRTRLAVLTKSDLASLSFDPGEAIERYRLHGWQVFLSTLAAPAVNALEAACVSSPS